MQIRAGDGAHACASARPDSHLEARAARAALVRRGAAASSVTTLIAATSHTVAGGPAPAPAIVLGTIVLLILPSGILLQAPGRGGRRHTGGLPRIALTTIVAQLAFHGLFSLLGSPHAGGPVIAGHHHGAPDLPSVHAAHVESPGMLAAHAAAALATIAILAYGDAVIRRGAGWIRRAARVLVLAPALPHVPRILAAARLAAAHVRVAVPPVGLRGPPAFS